MAHDVFICHSAKDKTTADAVCAMLESSGVRCWIAPRDVTAGMEWSECIIDAIEECRVMVLVFTTNANESSQIRREIERAVNRGVTILPLRIEDILPGRALEYFIGNVHWLDAMTPPLESHLNNLAGTVKILLGRLPRHEAAMPHGASQPTIFPEAEQIPAPALPKVEWAEPVRPPIAEPVTPEILRTPPAYRQEPPQVTPAPPPEPIRQRPVEIPEGTKASPPVFQAPVAKAVSAVAATAKLKRPMGVTAVAVLDFIFAGLMVMAFTASSNYERNEYGVWLILTGISAVVAGYGLIKLKNWGLIVEILLLVAGIGRMFSVVEDASRQLSGFAMWLAILALFGKIIWYMFTSPVRLAFGLSSQSAVNIETATSTESAARNSSSELFTRGTGRRPGVVLAIAILSFVEAGIWVLPIYGDFDRNRLAPRDLGAFLLLCAAAAIGFGLIKLMGWARLLKVVVAAVDAILMIRVAQDAFREGGFGELSWIGIFIYIIWSALYMFTPQVRRAFSTGA